MKFLAPISRFSSHEVSADSNRADFLVWPDSAQLPSGRPVFIPDFAPDFVAVPAVALRIDRLGKCISPKFAHRYFSHFSPAALFLPGAASEILSKGIPPMPADYCFDSSILLGNWEELPADASLSLSATFRSSAEVLSFEGNVERNVAYNTIHCASQRSTLKMGDVILLPFPGVKFSVVEDSSISISPSPLSQPLLITKFK